MLPRPAIMCAMSRQAPEHVRSASEWTPQDLAARPEWNHRLSPDEQGDLLALLDGYSIEDERILYRGAVMETTTAKDLPLPHLAPRLADIQTQLEEGAGAIRIHGFPCEGVDELARDTDAYVQTVIRRDIVEAIPNEMLQDILDYQSGVVQAAQTAARVGAKRLVMTHMVPAPTPEQYPEWIARAAEHFDGDIVIGDDLTTITI